jgi:NitT/TauT family transport system ATP-binding protein
VAPTGVAQDGRGQPGGGAGAPRIRFEKVSKRFPAQDGRGSGVTAVEDVTLSICDGEVVSLIGPSGCGKSTLLNMGSGLYLPSEGEVIVDGRRVEGPNPNVAFMLQKDLLLPWRRIRENVAFGLEIRGLPAAERRERASALMERCRLKGFEDHYPHQLSGGMRQRAALARTLAVDPHVLLLDEPFSALDAQTKMVLQADLARTLADERKTALFITHDLIESVALSDRVLVMSQRPGRIVRELVIDLPNRDDPFSRRQHPRIMQYANELTALLDITHQELH